MKGSIGINRGYVRIVPLFHKYISRVEFGVESDSEEVWVHLTRNYDMCSH